MTEKMEKTEKEIKKELVEWDFLDYAGRKPIHIVYKQHPKCPKCGDDLQKESLKPHWFPYFHVDEGLKCLTCGGYYLFGIPFSKDAGLALHVWDTNPIAAVAKFGTLGDRECRFRHGRMLKTKVFGDWHKTNVKRVRYQWKCATCFLTHHEWHDRDFPHGDDDPLTDEEKEMLDKRLRQLGYID